MIPEKLTAVFEAQAKRILKYLNAERRYDQEFLPPPFVVEFTGSPSSGKTTTIKQVYNFLRRHGFQVLMPQEGAEVIPARLRDKPDYNIQTALYALQILLRERREHRYDFILFDRCVFDAFHWMLYWHEKGSLTSEETEVLQKFFLSSEWVCSVGLVYVMVCSPEVALRRENEIALTDKLGETTNPTSIEKTIRRFTKIHNDLRRHFSQLRLVDTTSLDKREMILRVGSEILETFEKKAVELKIIR